MGYDLEGLHGIARAGLFVCIWRGPHRREAWPRRSRHSAIEVAPSKNRVAVRIILPGDHRHRSAGYRTCRYNLALQRLYTFELSDTFPKSWHIRQKLRKAAQLGEILCFYKAPIPKI